MPATVAQQFRADIAVQQHECGQYITDRIACHALTQLPHQKQDTSLEQRKQQYRTNFSRVLQDACAKHPEGIELVKKFMILARILRYSKAVALPQDYSTSNAEESFTLQEAWEKTLREGFVNGGKLLVNQSHLLHQPKTKRGIIHPLIIALLAFRLGGPINAANSAHAHQWRLPDQSVFATQVQNFHMEGDSGNIFDDHRVTFVWEEHEGRGDGPHGSHHIFLSGDVTPHPLETASLKAEHPAGEPLTIIYDSRNASLAYQCENPEVVRHSISLDFHVHTTPDSMLEFLQVMKEEVPLSGGDEFLDLLISYPTPQYSRRFHKLLFSPGSLAAIIDRLANIKDLEFPPPSSTIPQFMKRAQHWVHENQSCIPNDVLSMGGRVLISGTYSSTEYFLKRVILKARQDVHLPIGWDLFPEDLIDEGREYARKYLRDGNEVLVNRRLSKYKETLTKTPYTLSDLLSTTQLQGFANTIEKWCHEFSAVGFVSHASMLAHLPLFTRALGLALNGKREIQVKPAPHIDESDLQIYRTRCLYLFWCADWLVDYLGKPIEGPFQLAQNDQERSAELRAHVEMMASTLLRNWVAWGMFVEGLPQGGMTVGRLAVPGMP